MWKLSFWKGAVIAARPANLPTLVTNAAVAWVTIAGATGTLPLIYLGVLCTGVCFYLYGMWQNDSIDAKIDARLAPGRPVPAGLISATALRIAALTAALAGLVCNLLFGGEMWCGVLLLLCICFYNFFHKVWAGSCVLMGLSRGCWVLAAGLIYLHATGGGEIPASLYCYAGGLGLFTCLLTWVARYETQRVAVQKLVSCLLAGMCLFDAVWLIMYHSPLWIGAVCMWIFAYVLQRFGFRAS